MILSKASMRASASVRQKWNIRCCQFIYISCHNSLNIVYVIDIWRQDRSPHYRSDHWGKKYCLCRMATQVVLPKDQLFLFLFYLLVDLGSNCVWVLSKFPITIIRQRWLQPVNLPQTIIYRLPHLRATLLSMFLTVNHTSKNANSQTRQVWNAFHLSRSHFAGQGSLWRSSLSIDILRLCGVYANTVFAELEPELHENW